MKAAVTAEPERVRALLEAHMPDMAEECAEKLVKYYEILIEWNNRMNLTAVTDPEGVVERHFLDSIAGAELIPEGARCIDVGTGAGFPGVPLRLMRPDIEMTLLDSLKKRVEFLEHIAEALELPVKVVHMRAEDAGRSAEHRERYDIAVSRAVAAMNVLAEWTLPLVKVGGASMMYKGRVTAEELGEAERAFRELKAKAEVRAWTADWGERSVVIVRKTAATPAKYPRKPGAAQKNPL